MPDVILPADPKAGYIAHQHEIDKAIAQVLDSGWYILGEQVEIFEREFANYLGASHCVGVANGTDALHLALRACGIGTDDVVITVAHTAVATVAAIELAGAAPLLVDIDPGTFTISPEAVEEAIASCRGEERVKAIIVVHLYGCPADMARILEIANREGLQVIEDCAQAHGAMVNNRKAGTLGKIAGFSFYPTKNLGAIGDGGAVVTNTPELAEQVRLLREYGWEERYVSSLAGMNSRLDEIQAAILLVKLKWLDEENVRRREIARAYCERLQDSALLLPCEPECISHVYHQYVVLCDRRDELRAYLQGQGIGTLIHYPVPIHLQPAYRNRVITHQDGLPVTEKVARRILSLPMHPYLTDEQVERICDAIQSWS